MVEPITPTFLQRIFGSLFWRISFIFLIIVLMITFAYIEFSTDTSEAYFQERNQRLNVTLAQNIVDEVIKHPTDSAQWAAMHQLMEQVMKINPGTEMYVLDEKGQVLLPIKVGSVKITPFTVETKPLNTFINDKDKHCIKALDPKEPEDPKVFSAATFTDKAGKKGYIYVVLGGEQYKSATEALQSSYQQRVALRSVLFALIAAIIIGTFAVWYLTRSLRDVIQSVECFSKGNLKTRINLNSTSELTPLANTFNQMADRLVNNIEELKSTEKLRRELIANVSHDLRTPLAVIHGYVETLIIKEDTISPEERKKYINIILKSTDKLRKLVSGLFEFSKFEADQIKAQKEPFFIQELVHDISQQYQLQAKKKKITFNTHIPKNLPLVHADIALIERVFQNILDNAIKFTPKKGKVNVQIQQQQKYIEIIIKDNGIGINTDDLDTVFNRYHSQNRQQQNKEGTGLGLSIVKRILDLHESNYHIKSKIDKGTTFTFSLPIYEANSLEK